MSWDLSVGTGSGTSNKQEFASFPEGITRIRIIGEAPYMRWGHWWAAAKRTINCPGRDCPICEVRRTAKQNKQEVKINMTRRFSINIINRETNRVEILEQGVGFFEQLKDMKEEAESKGGNLQDFDLKVKRKGMKQEDTTYRVDLLESSPLSDADKKLAEKAIDHAEYFKAHTPEQILALLNGKTWEEVFTSAKTDETTDTSSDEEFTVE